MGRRQKSKPKSVPPKVSEPARVPARFPVWLTGVLTVGLILLAYWPALHNGFIWDDDAHLTQNPCIVGPLGLVDIWTSKAARICPLVQTTFWVGHKLWGFEPLPYHLLNILLHAGASVVLWLVLRRLKVPGAWFGAMLWALHPVSVESVAWVTEMKNTQSTLFYLLAIWFFVKWRQEASSSPPRKGWAVEKFYALALLSGALAMASKSSTVILPLVLILCAWWVEGRWRWSNALRLAPFLVFSAAASAVSMWTQKLEGATGAQYVRSGPERLITAGRVVWFYLGKLLWPQPLMFIYPRWVIDAGKITAYLPVVAVGVALFILWWKRGGWARPGFLALAYFLAALLPVLGILDHYFLRYSFVGDHFQYLASMGPLALAGAGLSLGLDRMVKGARMLKPVCGGILLAVLGAITWQRAAIFESSEILWRDTLAKNPACWVAHNNLGTILIDENQLVDAVAQIQEAIRLDPGKVESYDSLGKAMFKQGKIDEATALLEKALRMDPGYGETHNNMGNVLYAKGRVNEAIQQYREAIRLQPHNALAQRNLGMVLFGTGQFEAAVAQFQEVLRLTPNDMLSHYDLGIAFQRVGRMDEAIGEFQETIRLKPDYVEAHASLGNALDRKGRRDEAIGQFQEVLRIKPDFAEAHNNLGGILGSAGRIDEAINEFQEAIRLKPDYAEARDNLARALAMKASLNR